MTNLVKWALAILGLCCLIPASLLIGSVDIPLNSFFGNATDVERIIIVESRIPRTLAALFGGAGLSLGGLFMQTLFRNPLAGPSVLGLTSGSSLAVGFLMLSGGVLAASQLAVISAAASGALVVLLIILAVSRRFVNMASVLIVGLMLSFFSSSVLSVLQAYADETSLKVFVFWGFGSFSNLSFGQIPLFLIPVGLVIILSPLLIKPMNNLLPGELHAKSMGFDLRLIQTSLVVSTGVMVGVITAFCGPVAFIGLTAPHLARILFSTANIRIVLPGSLLIGSLLALFCDIVARWPFSEIALPLNTVCAFMGAPVIVYLILKGRKTKILS